MPGPHQLRSERRLLLTASASADRARGESQLQDEIPGWVWLDVNRPRLSPSEGWGTPGSSLRSASQVIWTQTPELRVCKSPVLWGGRGVVWTPRPPRSLDLLPDPRPQVPDTHSLDAKAPHPDSGAWTYLPGLPGAGRGCGSMIQKPDEDPSGTGPILATPATGATHTTS